MMAFSVITVPHVNLAIIIHSLDLADAIIDDSYPRVLPASLTNTTHADSFPGNVLRPLLRFLQTPSKLTVPMRLAKDVIAA